MRLKNTYYLILALSTLAALIIGLNIGKKIQQSQNTQVRSENQELSVTPTSTPILSEATNEPSSLSATGNPSTQSGFPKSATPSGGVKGKLYTSSPCGISLVYPETLTAEESSTQALGAVFTDKTNPEEIIVLTCQKDIPKPAISSQNIENITIGNGTGTLYHETSQKDGTKVDALIFTHPKTNLDVFIGGYGTTFNTIIQSLKIL